MTVTIRVLDGIVKVLMLILVILQMVLILVNLLDLIDLVYMDILETMILFQVQKMLFGTQIQM